MAFTLASPSPALRGDARALRRSASVAPRRRRPASSFRCCAPSPDGNKDGENERTGGNGAVLVRNGFGWVLRALGVPAKAELAKPQTEHEQQLDTQRQDIRRVWRLFLRLAAPYWKEQSSARWSLAGVVALTLLQSGISVAFSYIGRDFWNALSARDMDKFYEEARFFFVALTLGTPVKVVYSYSRDMLGLRWREWLSDNVLQRYLAERKYFQAESGGAELDNPDQRIAEDLRAFTQTSLQFILTMVISVVDLASFSSILFSIYPQLFLVLLAYAGFGTAGTALIGRRLINLNFTQLQSEADFRYALVRLRENAESVAFYKGEERERETIGRRFARVIANNAQLITWQRNLEYFTVGYRHLIQLLPALVVAPLYFQGSIELGVVSQSFSAFNHILNDLSLVVNRFEALSQFSAGIDRLGELEEFLDREALAEEECIELRLTPNFAGLSFHNACVLTPDASKRLLVRQLSARIDAGQRLLIVGASGSGKSSLLRAVAGLWQRGSGRIERLTDDGVLFLPQRPYCTLGTLREQLTYPSPPSECNYGDEELMNILNRVDLPNLCARFDGGLDALQDWSDILSLGEQQRLAFGRLLVRRPKLAILDEASSALDLQAEARLYRFLGETRATVISVGHRPSLLKYHDLLLRIQNDGRCVTETIREEQKKVAMQQL